MQGGKRRAIDAPEKAPISAINSARWGISSAIAPKFCIYLNKVILRLILFYILEWYAESDGIPSEISFLWSPKCKWTEDRDDFYSIFPIPFEYEWIYPESSGTTPEWLFNLYDIKVMKWVLGINLSLHGENHGVDSNGIKEESQFGQNQMNGCFPCPSIRIPTNNCPSGSNMQPGKCLQYKARETLILEGK